MYSRVANTSSATVGGGRALTREEQEAEDHRLAMQLQQEEERAAHNPRPTVATSQPTATSHQHQAPASRVAPASSATAARSGGAVDADYELALRLAGDTPQDYSGGATVTGGRQAAPTAHQPARRPSAPASGTATRSPEPQRKLTKEEQEAEDHRLAMELQALEEQGAHVPPGTASSAQSQSQPQQPQGTAASGSRALAMAGAGSSSQPPALHQAASVPDVVAVSSSGVHHSASSRGHDLFAKVTPGHVGASTSATAAPAATQQPPAQPEAAAKRQDTLDDIFAPAPAKPSPPPQQQQQQQQQQPVDPFAPPPAPAPAPAQPAGTNAAGGSGGGGFDFFADAPSGRAAPQRVPASTWGAPTQRDPTQTTERDLMDDLFAAAPPGQQQRPQQQRQQQPDMQQNLDMFAAGRGNRAW